LEQLSEYKIYDAFHFAKTFNLNSRKSTEHCYCLQLQDNIMTH